MKGLHLRGYWRGLRGIIGSRFIRMETETQRTLSYVAQRVNRRAGGSPGRVTGWFHLRSNTLGNFPDPSSILVFAARAGEQDDLRLDWQFDAANYEGGLRCRSDHQRRGSLEAPTMILRLAHSRP
jgi:hypothetical protein